MMVNKSNQMPNCLFNPQVVVEVIATLGCLLFVSQTLKAQDDSVTLPKRGANAPNVQVTRDDRVATLELDFEEGNPWTPFDIGEDGLGPVGYRVVWGVAGQAIQQLESKVTSLRRTQIQPLDNDERYAIRVDYVNRFGELVGSPAIGTIGPGGESRVAELRQQMTGFFDDFNLAAGLPDERKWNTTFSRINDPDLQGFFINSQFHTHTLVGTPAYGFGDRGQTTHRIRNKLQLGAGETRRIVFDLDGVNVGARSIWYLDVLKEESEITSHFTLGGGEGFSGHPSPGLRFSLKGQEIALFTINQKGEQLLLAENRLLDFEGVQTFPNVRRSFEILLSETDVSILIDGVNVLESPLGDSSLLPGDYTVHWTAFGYNTMKVGMPYFLLHWDNFGFDGPGSDHIVHNYRTQVMGTDYVQSDNFEPVSVQVRIPDNLTPTRTGVLGEARLVFTRQMENWQYANWSESDKVMVGDQEFQIESPASVANPPLALEQLINTNAAYSTYIPLGTVGENGTAPLVQGINEVIFEAAGCGFHNVHIEVKYPRNSAPPYTSPKKMHGNVMHHALPKVGLPARISRIGGQEVDSNVWNMNEIENFNADVSGVINVGAIVNGEEFYDASTLHSDFVGASLAATGENPGIQRVQLWIRPNDGGDETAILLDSIETAERSAAPQFIHEYSIDTANFENGVYELFFVAEDTRGVLSIPDFGGVGRQAGSPQALNGFYFPLHITINN